MITLPSRPWIRGILLGCLLAAFGIVALTRPLPAHAQAGPGRVFLPSLLGGSITTASDTRIDQALARGEIDAETALVYKTYAAFNDPRLPARFHGDDSQDVDSSIVAEVGQRFDTLSPATQALLSALPCAAIHPGELARAAGRAATGSFSTWAGRRGRQCRRRARADHLGQGIGRGEQSLGVVRDALPGGGRAGRHAGRRADRQDLAEADRGDAAGAFHGYRPAQ